MTDRLLHELVAGERLQSGLLLDPPADLLRIDAWLRLREHEREHLSLRRCKEHRLAVPRVDDRKALKRAECLGDSHEHRAAVVHLEHAAETERLAWPDQLVAGIVHDHGIGLAEIGDRSHEDSLRCADERGVVHTQENHLVIVPLLHPRPGEPLVKPHRPLDTRHSFDAKQAGVGQRLDVVDELDVFVHHPDAGPLDVADLTDGERHQPAENRRLLRDEQRGEHHAEHDAEVFHPVSDQHFPGNPEHGGIVVEPRRKKATRLFPTPEGLPMPREPALLGHRSVSADWSSQAGCRSAVSIE